jgi:hypothetical protein
MDRELIINWLYKVKELNLGDKVYIPGETKDSCKRNLRRFNKELDLFFTLNPDFAGTISASYSFKDSEHWIVLKRLKGRPHVGFVKKASGEVEKTSIVYSPEKERLLKLMKNNNFSFEEAKEIDSSLTEEKWKEIE